MLEEGPAAAGYADQCWTLARVAEQAWRLFGVEYTDRARFLDAAHRQLRGPLVLVWDGLNTRTSRAMRELTAARPWLTVFQLPAHAPELNPSNRSGRT